MRVLFVPSPAGGPSHLFPLVALNRMLEKASIESAFLLSRPLRPLADAFRLKVLDVEHLPFGAPGFRTEMRAYGMFSPSVVVDDTGMTTGLTTALMKVPRVTIQRTGTFPHGVPRDSRHHHSLEGEGPKIDWANLPDVTLLGLRQPRRLTDLFDAACKIVPGIPSVEVLPAALRGDRSYFFSGPLLVDDYFIGTRSSLDGRSSPLAASSEFDAIEHFLARNAGRRRVFVTLGTVAATPGTFQNCIRHLLDRGMAVLSTVEVDGLSPEQRERFFHGTHLPMHLCVKNVDLMIHQCGSGTYQYSLLHGVPSLTIGTQCYDREDVAKRLEELGVSLHLASATEEPDLEARFAAAIARYVANDGALLSEARRRLAPLQAATSGTAATFDLAAILRHAVSRPAATARR